METQRVAEKDANLILEKIIKNDDNNHFPAVTYEEDYAGGSLSYVRRDLVELLIKKLSR